MRKTHSISNPLDRFKATEVEAIAAFPKAHVDNSVNILKLLVACDGVILDTIQELDVAINSLCGDSDIALSCIASMSEFALVDTLIVDKKLVGLELLDNSVFFLAIHNEHKVALDSALLLSVKDGSAFTNVLVRPTLSLYGLWEDIAIRFIELIIDTKSTIIEAKKLNLLVNRKSRNPLHVREFIAALEKLSAAGVFIARFSENSQTFLEINGEAAILFLVLCGRADLATKVAGLRVD